MNRFDQTWMFSKSKLLYWWYSKKKLQTPKAETKNFLGAVQLAFKDLQNMKCIKYKCFNFEKVRVKSETVQLP